MTVIPQLQQALVEAAAAPHRRKRALWRAARPALALAVLVVASVVGLSTLRDPAPQRAGLTSVGAESVEKAAALAAAPKPTGESSPSSPDALAGFARQLQTALPYPPGRSDDELAAVVARQTGALRADVPGMSQVTAKRDVRSQAEFRAACTWQRFWLDAEDLSARSAATEILQSVPRWPSMRSSAQAPAIAAAARMGDIALIQRQVELNCSDRLLVR